MIDWTQIAAYVLPTIAGSVLGTVGTLCGLFWKFVKKKIDTWFASIAAMQTSVEGFAEKFESMEKGFAEVKSDVHKQREDLRIFKGQVDIKWNQIEKDVLKAISDAATIKQIREEQAKIREEQARIAADIAALKTSRIEKVA